MSVVVVVIVCLFVCLFAFLEIGFCKKKKISPLRSNSNQRQTSPVKRLLNKLLMLTNLLHLAFSILEERRSLLGACCSLN